jgi:hypothetical protein
MSQCFQRLSCYYILAPSFYRKSNGLLYPNQPKYAHLDHGDGQVPPTKSAAWS